MARTFSNGHALLDALLKFFKMETDKDLAAAFGVQPAAISKIRIGVNRVSPEMILKVHRMTRWPIDRILLLADYEEA